MDSRLIEAIKYLRELQRAIGYDCDIYWGIEKAIDTIGEYYNVEFTKEIPHIDYVPEEMLK